MPVHNRLFQNIVEKDFFWAMCEERLGGGMSRDVYSSRLDPTVVIKFEDGKGHFQNVMEWEAWQEVKDTEFSKWFAPIVGISDCGTILIQKRTKPLKPSRYPLEMPAFLGDFKHTNYGMYKGHLCAHDYGRTRLMTAGLTKRMIHANWVQDIESS